MQPQCAWVKNQAGMQVQSTMTFPPAPSDVALTQRNAGNVRGCSKGWHGDPHEQHSCHVDQVAAVEVITCRNK